MSGTMYLNLPNLPGMIPNRSSWIQRQQDGFGRITQLTRPNSAVIGRVPSSPTTYEIQATTSNQLKESESVPMPARPSTAGGYRVMNPKSNQSEARPQTAGASLRSPAWYTYGDRDNIVQAARMQPVKHPKYVELDKKVCRFFGHFYENRIWEKDAPLGDPVVETKIPRKLNILYYLVDDTIEMSEPSEVNSGMQGGIFFRRGKMTKDNLEPLLLKDFLVGGSVYTLGQEIFITDADLFTRDYFRSEFRITLGRQLSRPPIVRKDIGAQYATGLGAAVSNDAKFNYATCSPDYLAAKEALDKTYLFLKYDGRVLRFLCVEVPHQYPPYFPELYNDLNSNLRNTNQIVAPDSAKKFALSFYLADKKLDLVLQRVPHVIAGKESHSQSEESRLVMKKSKLPKNWRQVQDGRHPPQYYEMEDFRCGLVIDVYGRYFLLVDCDQFTKNMYREIGIVQSDVPLIKQDPDPVVHPIPQLGDGFLPIGSAEDTLATVFGQPKPHRDMLKAVRNHNRTIRTKAILLADNDIDASREFMITFFMEDDTIQVYEENKRNSGFVGGTFLKRGRYLNYLPTDSKEPRLFLPTDIFLGNIVSFHGFEMQITEIDNLSLKFCEGFPDEFPMSDTFKIIGALMDKAVSMGIDMRAIFISKDADRQGYISQDTFVATLDELGLSDTLNDHELLTVLRRFKDDQKYCYHEFCDLVSHSFYDHYKADRPHQSPKRHVGVTASDFSGFLTTARSRTTQWRRTFRKEPHTLAGCCTLSVLGKIFEKHGLILSPGVMMEIYNRFSVSSPDANRILEELSRNRANEDIYPDVHKKFEASLSAGHIGKLKRLRAKQNANRDNSKGNNLKLDTKLFNGLGSASAINPTLGPRKSSINLIPSILRQNGSNTGSGSLYRSGQSGYNAQGELINYATVLINYNKLCDAIYICDWL